jgi:cell division protease FtsH
MDSKFKFKTKASAIYAIIAFFLILMLQEIVIGPMRATEEKVPYSQFRKDLASGGIAEVVVEPERILYSVKGADKEEDKNSKVKNTRKAVRIEDGNLVEELVAAGVDFKAEPIKRGILGPLLSWILPVIPFVVIWFFLMKRMGGGPRGLMSVGKSKATEITGQMEYRRIIGHIVPVKSQKVGEM